MKTHITKLRIVTLGAALLALGLTGCSTTSQTRKVEPSRFLNNYSQLRQGQEEEALLVYQKPGVRWSQYTKIQLDPIQLWYAGDSDLSAVPPEELQALVDTLNAALRTELQTNYTFVTQSGPDVMRLRVAITEAKRASVPANVVSTVIPQIKLLSGVKKLATGTHMFVGRTAVEAEILDSRTDERLWAGVDERAGGKTFRGMTSAWNDVEEAYTYWAKRMNTRLAEERAK
jgi:hypothetical protein